jgi:anaerobic magnesium-protoporphyrin IX monomethyl ester cyclase
MVDVLLIQPPIRDFYLTAKRTVPYGLACIAEALSAAGFTVAIHDALAGRKTRDLPLPASLAYLTEYFGRPDASPFGLFHRFRHYGHSTAHIARKAAESGAWLIGISALFTAYAQEALETAAAVRAACPDAFIVMGGHHPTEMPETVLGAPAVDAVFRGEGEAGMAALARVLKTGGDPARVPGIALPGDSDSPPISEPVAMAALDDYPPPSRRWTHQRRYRRKGLASLTLVTSRGCPKACSYCATGRHSYMRYRRRATDAVLAEIAAAAAAETIGFIDFEDENLALDRAAFLDLLAGIKGIFGEALPELRAMNGLYPPSLDDAVVGAMSAAGFKTLNLSLGSASTQQSRRFNRPPVREAFDAAVNAARRHEMAAVGYIIVGAPGQSARDSVDDLLYLSHRRVLIGVSVFYPAPGSRDFLMCRERGLLPEDLAAWRSTAIPISDTTSRLESATLLRLGRLVNYMKRLKDEMGALAFTGGTAHGVGTNLLARFLNGDGIWGVTPDGECYPHRISEDLARYFLSRFDIADVCGTQ